MINQQPLRQTDSSSLLNPILEATLPFQHNNSFYTFFLKQITQDIIFFNKRPAVINKKKGSRLSSNSFRSQSNIKNLENSQTWTTPKVTKLPQKCSQLKHSKDHNQHPEIRTNKVMINTVVNTGIWKITATRNILQNFKLQIWDFIENLSKLNRGANLLS